MVVRPRLPNGFGPVRKDGGVMANWRSGAGRWAWTLATAAAVVASIGADGSKPAREPAKAGEKPPEVVQSDESDDVDGRSRPASEKPKGSPTLQPAELDALIDKGLAASKTPPSEPTNDDEFIRRAYLDLLGKLPAPPAVRQFAQSRDRDKRAKLVDALLAHPDHAENWARYWRDVIEYRSPVENDRNIDYSLFTKWLAEQFAANKRWDRIATEIITARGRTDEAGATIFPQAEDLQPVEMAGEVSRIFLGVQIQCAQCHDHPSDPWKRQQFHEFAAFFGGVKKKVAEKREKGKPAIFEVYAATNARYLMPDLKDPAKKIPVAPRFFLGDEPPLSDRVPGEARLEAAAKYVTSPENPWFAKAFINRTWYALMGEGFFNPIDDLGPTRTPNSPEILELLTDQWQRSGYDIRWLFRTIMNTRAYQRQSRSTNTAAGRTPFASNVPSRLRADQIFDALVHALNLDQVPAAQLKEARTKGAAVKKAVTKEADPTEPPGRRQVLNTFGVDPSTSADDVVGTIPQALYLMNGPLIARQTQARPGTMLGELISSASNERSAVDALYMKILARHPNTREMSVCMHHVSTVGDHREAFEDILWSLINSTEFVSRR